MRRKRRRSSRRRRRGAALAEEEEDRGEGGGGGGTPPAHVDASQLRVHHGATAQQTPVLPSVRGQFRDRQRRCSCSR
eukprot:3025578-Pyramimonas_sp.AAC.1